MIAPSLPPRTQTAAHVVSVMPHWAEAAQFTVSTDHELSLAKSFMDSLVGEAVSAKVRDAGVKFLRELRREIPGLTVPTIAPGSDGLLGFTWESKKRHINIQFFENGTVEYFAENLETHELWSEEHPAANLSTGLMAQLLGR